MLVCVYYCAFGTRDRGCSRHPAFPAPSVWRVTAKNLHHSGEIAPRGRERMRWIRRVGKATTSAGSSTSEGGSVPTATKMVGTSQALLCPPYKTTAVIASQRVARRLVSPRERSNPLIPRAFRNSCHIAGNKFDFVEIADPSRDDRDRATRPSEVRHGKNARNRCGRTDT